MSYEYVRAVLENSEQTSSARLVMLVIAEHADKNGVSYPGNELIADESKLSVRQVQRIIKKISDTEELEIIEPGDGRGRKRIMQINLEKGDISGEKGDTDDTVSGQEKGDIHGKKGDISDIKGDTAMSPEPVNHNTPNGVPLEQKPLAEQFHSLLAELKETKNRGAVLMTIYELCYGDHEGKPSYGYLGKVSKTIGGAGYLAQKLWQLSARPPSGDVLAYILAEHKGKRKRDQYGSKNGHNLSTFSQGEK